MTNIGENKIELFSNVRAENIWKKWIYLYTKRCRTGLCGRCKTCKGE